MHPRPLCTAFFTLSLGGTIGADVITVGPGLDAETITTAIALAVDGDELAIASGTWSPSTPDGAVAHLTNRILTLRPLDPDNPPTLDGGTNGRALIVDGGSITLQQLICTGGSVAAADIDGDGLTMDWERSGGAIATNNATLALHDCTISGGAALHGGCIGAWNSQLALVNCSLSGGIATFFGGGMRVHGGSLHMNGGQIDNCLADTGGGLLAGGGTLMNIDSVAINACTATWYGGGMHIDGSLADDPIMLQRTTVQQCAAAQAGGGVYAWRGELTADDVDISNCTATNGAAWAVIETTFTLDGSAIAQNIASGDGGGVWAVEASVLVQTCLFNNNEAAYGAGMMSDWCTDVACLTSTFENNAAVLRGGAVYADGVGTFDTAVEFCQVRTNSAGLGVDGIVFAGGNAGRVSDSLFCGQSQHVGGTWTNLGGNAFADQCSSTSCDGDVDGSGAIGLGDIAMIVSAWGNCDGACAADTNDDGQIDVRDLIEILMRWDEAC